MSKCNGAAVKAMPGESIESLLRRFKAQVERAEVLETLRDHEYYIKPSDKKNKSRSKKNYVDFIDE